MTSPERGMPLLPCPFCNGAAAVRPDDIGSGGQHVPPYHAGCWRCMVMMTEEDEAAANPKAVGRIRDGSAQVQTLISVLRHVRANPAKKRATGTRLEKETP